MKRHSLLFALFIFLSSLSIQAEGPPENGPNAITSPLLRWMKDFLTTSWTIYWKTARALWIATRGEGIARYDGYEFTAFNMGSTHTKLRSNFINKLCEDNFKRIWAVSEMGIDILDIQTMQTVQVADTKDKLISLCNRPPISFSIAKREIFGFVRKTIYSKLPLTNKEI